MADFLGSVFAEDAPVDEPQADDAPQPPQEPQAEPETVTPEPAAPEPVIEQKPETAREEAETRNVPLTVVLDERDRRKAAEQERDRLKQELEQARQRPAPNVPDPYDDPKGFDAYQEQRVQAAVTQQRFQMSELMAKQTHGEETVTKASEWALEKSQNDPTFAAAYHRQAHPIDWIVQQHKREAMLSDIGDNVDDWFTREAMKRGYAPAPVVAAAPAVAPMQQARQPAPPPRSIASDAAAPTANAPLDERAGFLANLTR